MCAASMSQYIRTAHVFLMPGADSHGLYLRLLIAIGTFFDEIDPFVFFTEI